MTNNSRPLVPVNPEGLDEVAAALLAGTSEENSETDTPRIPQLPRNIINPEKYLYLPAKNHGSYSYQNTLISLERSHNGKNWFDTHKLLSAEGKYMPTIRQFVDFVKLLKSGKALNGKGEIMPQDLVVKTLEDIFKLGEYRGRWLDADFKVVNRTLHINYNHSVNAKGEIIYGKSEPLISSTLMADRKPGIDLMDWIVRATVQGLPPSDVKQGDIWYWYPRRDNNSVAGFSANADRAVLGCDWDPSHSDSRLGVNAAQKI